jgi:hypothetical protein
MSAAEALAAARQAALAEGKAVALGAVLPCQLNKTWIEVLVVDAADQPVPGVSCMLDLPDGRKVKVTTGDDGVASVMLIDPGECAIELPDYDLRAWSPGHPPTADPEP